MNKRVLIFAIVYLLSFTVWAAQNLPSYYPQPLPITGVIERIDYNARLLVILDSQYRIQRRTQVHTLHSVNDSIKALSKGDKIAFIPMQRGKKLFISEIWKLPDDYPTRRGR